MCKYPKWFKPEKYLKINSDIDNSESYTNCRFSMIMTVDETLEKDLMMILMNPSKANCTESDPTINRVLKYAQGRYRKVYLYNTLPVYETLSEKVKKVIEENPNEKIIEVNTEVVVRRLENTDFKQADLILATGNPVPVYGEEPIDRIYETIKKNNIPICFFTQNGEDIEVNKFQTNHKRYTKHLRVITNDALDRDLVKGNIENLIKKINTK